MNLEKTLSGEMNKQKLLCDNCKEKLDYSDDYDEEDGGIKFYSGNEIYCVGLKSPHNHYKDYSQAKINGAENEIREATVIRTR